MRIRRSGSERWKEGEGRVGVRNGKRRRSGSERWVRGGMEVRDGERGRKGSEIWRELG